MVPVLNFARAMHRGDRAKPGTTQPSPRGGLMSYAALTLETNSFCLHRFADWWRQRAGWPACRIRKA